MNQTDYKIYIAGHRGMVGSAIGRRLEEKDCKNLISRSHKELASRKQRVWKNVYTFDKKDFSKVQWLRVLP